MLAVKFVRRMFLFFVAVFVVCAVALGSVVDGGMCFDDSKRSVVAVAGCAAVFAAVMGMAWLIVSLRGKR